MIFYVVFITSLSILEIRKILDTKENLVVHILVFCSFLILATLAAAYYYFKIPGNSLAYYMYKFFHIKY